MFVCLRRYRRGQELDICISLGKELMIEFLYMKTRQDRMFLFQIASERSFYVKHAKKLFYMLQLMHTTVAYAFVFATYTPKSGPLPDRL